MKRPLPPYSWLASRPVDDSSLHVPLDGLIISPPNLFRQEVSAAQQGDLKVAKAGLQGAAGPLPEREERCPGDSVSDPAKTLFSCFSCVAAGDTRKTGRER